MNKCPSCGGPNDALARICTYCGKEFPLHAAPVAASAADTAALPGAVELCTGIQQDLALLAGQPPPSRPTAFVIGLITLPTFGLGTLAFRIIRTFGQTGRSARRLLVALDQSLRLAESSYRSDTKVCELVATSRAEIARHDARRRSAQVAFAGGVLLSLILGAIAAIAWMRHTERQTRVQTLAAIETARVVKTNEDDHAALEATKRAEQERAEYVAHYIGETPPASPADRRVAVLVSDGRSRDAAATQAIVDLLRGAGRDATGSLFTDAVVTDGIFTRLFAGNAAEIQRLGLEKHAGEIVLVRAECRLTDNRKVYTGLMAADMKLEAHHFSTATGASLGSYVVTAQGAGIGADAASGQALERCLAQLPRRLPRPAGGASASASP